MKRIIVIPTCHVYNYAKDDEGAAHNSGANQLRSQAIRSTWYKTWREDYSDQIDVKFFYGWGSDRSPDMDEVFLDCPDDYYSLPLKVQKTFQWCLEKGYDHVFKVDDDVFVHVDRLLREFKPTDYCGFSNGWFISGAAYWISRRAMEIVSGAQWNKEHWAEDQFVGKTLGEQGIVPQHDERFQVCHCDVCIKKFSEEQRITLHTNGPELMYKLGKQYG